MVEQQADDTVEDRRRTIGRPPLQVSLSATAAYAVGLDFGHSHVRSAVCDLRGTIVGDQWAASDVDDHPVGQPRSRPPADHVRARRGRRRS